MPKTMYAIFSDQAYDDFMNGKAVDNNGFRSPKGYFYSDQPSFSPLYPRQEQIKDAGLKLAIAAGGYVLFDIALPGIKRFSHEKVYPFFAEKQCISNPIDEVIEKVVVVQENQRLYENNRLLYDVWITRGLIFDFGDHQISFEKGPWLSEQIVIRKGYNLISEFTPESKIMEPFSNNGVMNCERTIITIC